jgi:hypothetical protein
MGAYNSTRVAKSWNIDLPNAKEIEITFDWIDTEKVYDKIRVFENFDGSGALVSILYGKRTKPTTIKVKSSGAFISFTTTTSKGIGEGFTASYKAIY